MQTSKILLVIGAAMIFSAPSLLAAKSETEAQIKMREALRLKMEELNAQETPPAQHVLKPIAPKPVNVQADPAKPKTVVVAVPAIAKVEFSDPVSEVDSAAAERMKEALQRKMAELDAAYAPVVVSPTPAAKSQPKVVVAPKKPMPTKKAPAKPIAPAVAAAPAVVIKPAPAQIEAPASPLPVTKQSRLAELLSRYKADRLSAQDYHTQRAAILGEK